MMPPRVAPDNGPHEGCAKRGGICDCAGRPCAVDERETPSSQLNVRCPTCGSGVVIASSDEGTNHYVSAGLTPGEAAAILENVERSLEMSAHPEPYAIERSAIDKLKAISGGTQ